MEVYFHVLVLVCFFSLAIMPTIHTDQIIFQLNITYVQSLGKHNAKTRAAPPHFISPFPFADASTKNVRSLIDIFIFVTKKKKKSHNRFIYYKKNCEDYTDILNFNCAKFWVQYD